VRDVAHNNVSVHAGFQYDFSPEIMGYLTFATGYKGPTVSNIQGEARPIKPEDSNDFEAGVKSELFDRRLTLNIAAFLEKYRNFQAEVYDTSVTPAQFTLGNAGGLRSEGVEADFIGKVDSALSFTGGATYAYATYTSFTGQCYTGQPISTDVGSGCYKDPSTGKFAANLAGYPVNMAPKWSFTAQANYTRPIIDGYVLDANANYVWKSDVYTVVPDPQTIVKAHGLLGINVGLSPEAGAWRLGVFARNLLDQHFVNAIFPNLFDPGGYAQGPAVEARRTVGVMLDFNFGR
jgi:iron complex outermembrane receptor protein